MCEPAHVFDLQCEQRSIKIIRDELGLAFQAIRRRSCWSAVIDREILPHEEGLSNYRKLERTNGVGFYLRWPTKGILFSECAFGNRDCCHSSV